MLDELKDVLDVDTLVTFGRREILDRHVFLKQYLRPIENSKGKPEIVVKFSGIEKKLKLPIYGEHNAMNAMPVQC